MSAILFVRHRAESIYENKIFCFIEYGCRQRSVADDVVEFGNIAQVGPESVVDFGIVEDQHFSFGLPHDGVAHFVFGYGSVRDITLL